MTLVVNNLGIDEVVSEFNSLIENIQMLIAENGFRGDVRSTKLVSYQKKIEKLNTLPADEIAEVIGIVNKYRQLNVLFEENTKIDFEPRGILDLLKGSIDEPDTEQRYNDTFLEISMAIRFALMLNGKSTIDTTKICDVIVGDQYAIECKYIHSRKRITDNIKKACKQIDTRIDHRLAKLGVVSLDFSNLMDIDDLREFARNLQAEFLSSYAKLSKNSVYAQMIKKEGLLKSVGKDKNFQAAVNGYLAHKIEVEFHDGVRGDDLNNLGINTVAITYQYSGSICLEVDSEILPIPIRSMGYYINPKLPELYQQQVKRLLHHLATGI